MLCISRELDSLGHGNILRQLDSLGHGNILRQLDSLGHGNILRQLESLGGGNILREADGSQDQMRYFYFLSLFLLSCLSCVTYLHFSGYFEKHWRCSTQMSKGLCHELFWVFLHMIL